MHKTLKMVRPKGTTKPNNRKSITIRVSVETYEKLARLRKVGFKLGRYIDIVIKDYKERDK